MKKEGFCYEFNPSKCDECGGKCCTGESGYIWISQSEISNLSKYLNLSVDECKERYLDKFGVRYSIKEAHYQGGFRCIFFDEVRLNCGIYECRPTQCRTFPFWDYFKKNYDELEKECIGVKPL